MKAVLPSVYFGNIRYFRILSQSDAVVLDVAEHFEKQTFRNRCEIMAANGSLDLIVPVKKDIQPKRVMKDLRISNQENWQRQHWRSLQSAYKAAPYFEFYEHHLQSIFEKRYEFLLDLNMDCLHLCMRFLELNSPTELSAEYLAEYADAKDYRASFDPKKPAEEINFSPYTQVFETKHGFVPNKSILDLLFNTGPEAVSYLV
jgi:hypothetical protein